jgi:hypothetical protein
MFFTLTEKKGDSFDRLYRGFKIDRIIELGIVFGVDLRFFVGLE